MYIFYNNIYNCLIMVDNSLLDSRSGVGKLGICEWVLLPAGNSVVDELQRSQRVGLRQIGFRWRWTTRFRLQQLQWADPQSIAVLSYSSPFTSLLHINIYDSYAVYTIQDSWNGLPCDGPESLKWNNNNLIKTLYWVTQKILTVINLPCILYKYVCVALMCNICDKLILTVA